MSNEYKIYTKTGDRGSTSLLGGTRVPKDHDRIEAYGTLDELNSFIGLLRDQNINAAYRETLIRIQDNIFTAESHLASDKPENVRSLPAITEQDVLFLEHEIDQMNSELPELRSFILPGGHPAVSVCHIARTVCRRAERIIIKISRDYPVDEMIIKYINRLSDYFFVLARKIAFDLHAPEISWQPKKTKQNE
ncbi:MAG: cob(I)yrinic acid a,c-diamide adenosyltransferase [Bacteroidales bacterium]|nr:cob(I)yrinic acid a,c-diamide adenosyltransferase [Bacteroidales bacterium]